MTNTNLELNMRLLYDKTLLQGIYLLYYFFYEQYLL